MNASETAGFHWRGFLTAGYSQAASDVSYLSRIGKDPNFLYDTRLGVAFTAPVTEQIDADGQFVAYGATDDYLPNVDWAFVTYRPNDSLRVRAGKIRFPLWLTADYYHVGYAYPWARPPPELYSTDLLSSFHGALARYDLETDFGSFSASLYGGSSPFRVPLNAELAGQTAAFQLRGTFEKLIGATLTFDSLRFRARATFANTWANLEFVGNIDNPGATALAPGILLFTQTRLRVPFAGQYNLWSAGFRWKILDELEMWTEYLGSKLGDNDTAHNGYVTLVAPLGTFSPHLTVARAGTYAANYYRYAVGGNVALSQNTVFKAQVDAIDPVKGAGPLVKSIRHVAFVLSANLSVVF